MRCALLAALSVVAGPACAQPTLEEWFVLQPPRHVDSAAPEFSASAPRPTGFQTRIMRASIRDHLRDYRVRVLQDGFAVQRRFTVGR